MNRRLAAVDMSAVLSDDSVERAFIPLAVLTRFLPAASPQLPPMNLALHLIGYTAPVASEAEGLRLIGGRIGLPEDATREQIFGCLRERGDRDILHHLDPTA